MRWKGQIIVGAICDSAYFLLFIKNLILKMIHFSVAKIFLPVRWRGVGRAEGVRGCVHAGELRVQSHRAAGRAVPPLHQLTQGPKQVPRFSWRIINTYGSYAQLCLWINWFYSTLVISLSKSVYSPFQNFQLFFSVRVHWKTVGNYEWL